MEVFQLSSQAALDVMQVITFDLHRNERIERFAVPIDKVREICTIESVTGIPNTTPAVRGIMNLRNNIIPLIDIKQKLGLSDGTDDISKQQILITENNGHRYGLLVDIVHEVIKIKPSEIQSIPQDVISSNNSMIGVVKANEVIITLLDTAKII